MRARLVKTAVRVAAILCLALAVAGCWSRRELETLGFIVAAGIDSAQEEGKIQLTVQIVKPFALSTGERAVSPEKPFWTVSSTGQTLLDAVRNLLAQSPRVPFWSHNLWLLIGEEYCRGGIGDILDLFERDGETRRRMQIAVAKGATAYDLLHAEFELERLPSSGGRGILHGLQNGSSTVVSSTVLDLDRALEGEGINPVLTRVEIVPRPKNPDTRGELLRNEIGASARLTGAAVLKNDRLVGWLDKSEARGLNWITSKIKSGVIVIKQPGLEDKLIGLEILWGSGGFKTEVRDGRITVLIKVRAYGVMADVQGFIDPLAQPEVWDSMERRMAAVIQNETAAAVSKAQELNSDIFGFGAELNRTDHRKWEELRDRWDELFPTIDVRVEVDAKLRRSGLVVRSVRITE